MREFQTQIEAIGFEQINLQLTLNGNQVSVTQLLLYPLTIVSLQVRN